MREYKGFNDIEFTNWLMFKMLIQIYGEDKLIQVLQLIKDNGGIKKVRSYSA